MLESLYQADYWLSRLLVQRGVGFTYLMAFLVALNQFRPLLGENGLMPVTRYLKRVSFRRAPSIFHWYYSDRFFTVIAGSGILLSLVALSGLSEMGPLWFSMLIWVLLWILYLSIVNVGQIFYGFGWESLLLEAGFYMIFMGPLHYQSPIIVIFLIRWLVFRVEFGAGLIKMRGDRCWRNLTCMNYHHETQPMPNPLSRFFHHLPKPLHKIETFFNHVIQLGVVWLLFAPQPVASYAATFIIISQLYLVISGNYAWLNWLTIILATSGFSDQFLQSLTAFTSPADLVQPDNFYLLTTGLAIIVIYLSIKPVRNMISPHQRMNFSYNSLHLVNTYGAFGSVTRKRNEIVIEGTSDSEITSDTEWKPYEFKGKPGDPSRIPSQIAPYHLRLDWQIWFAAMSSMKSNPWLLRFILRLLQGYEPVLRLLKKNPFSDKPPQYVRARLFLYRFSTIQEKKITGNHWQREFVRLYMPPRTLADLRELDY